MIYLDDDCLGMIFGYLKLKDQLALTKVCTRFNAVIIEYIWRKRYRQIHTHYLTKYDVLNLPHEVFTSNLEMELLNKQEYQEFFTLNAKNIRSLYIHDFKRTAFNSYLGRYTQRPDLLFYLLLEYSSLTVLDCEHSGLHDGHIHRLAKSCSMLEELRISSEYITGNGIKTFSKLRRLTASHCQFQPSYLNEILTEIDSLIFLDIEKSTIKTGIAIKTWGTNLRELHIGENQFLEHMDEFSTTALLGEIKYLNVFCNSYHENLNHIELLMLYLKQMSSRVKKLKICDRISIIQGFQCTYYSPILPCIEELRLDLTHSFEPTSDYMETIHIKASILNSVEVLVSSMLKLMRFDSGVDLKNLKLFTPPTATNMPIELYTEIKTDGTRKVKLFVKVDREWPGEKFLSSFQIEFH